MSEEKTDNIFAIAADQTRDIHKLVDCFFGFLFRRTDFFYSKATGIHTEAAKKIILDSYENYAAKAVEQVKRKEAAEKVKEIPVKQEAPVSTKIEPVINELNTAKKKENAETENAGEEVLQDPSVGGNGGFTDKYVWTQTLSTLDVVVNLKKIPYNAKACKVKIEPSHFTVAVNDEIIVDGSLHDQVLPTESYWTLEDKSYVHVLFEKKDRMKWWSCLIEGDPKIDTKKIQPENSKLSDLDPELRQTVEKMMYDQEQKARGLPTSDQRKQAEILEAFKKQHPEMDFSQAKINWDNQSSSFPM